MVAYLLNLLRVNVFREDLHSARKVLSSFTWLSMCSGITLLIGIATEILFARIRGPQVFGSFAFAASYVFLFRSFAQLAVDEIAIKRLIDMPANTGLTLGSIFHLRLIGALAASALMFLILPLAGPEDLSGTAIIVAVLSISLFATAGQTFELWFYARMVPARVVLGKLCGTFIGALVKVALIVSGFSLVMIAGAYAFEAAAIACGVVVAFWTAGGGSVRLQSRSHEAKAILSQSWPFLLAQGAITIYMRIDQVMLGSIIGAEAVGIYSVATRIVYALIIIPSLMVTAFLPAVIAGKQQAGSGCARPGGVDFYKVRLILLYRIAWASSLAACIFVSAFAEPIISILFGSKYMQSIEVMRILVWCLPASFLGTTRTCWLVAERLQRFTPIYIAAGAAVNVLGNLIAIPAYGTRGAAAVAVATVVTSTFLVPAMIPATRASVGHFFQALWVHPRPRGRC